jgi:hypothetical protein
VVLGGVKFYRVICSK